MGDVLSIARARELGDDDDPDPLAGLSPEERAARILEREFPILCNDIAAIVRRPFRLIWDPTIRTANTDCIAEIRMAPWFFMDGARGVGYGTAYHECGHIRYSPWGAEFLRRAQQEGGEALRDFLNLIMDRRDDLLNAEEAPGFAPTLRGRLAYICTMVRRQLVGDRIAKLHEVAAAPSPVGTQRPKRETKDGKLVPFRPPRVKPQEVECEITRMLKGVKPRDAHEDFFFACKWHKRPRTTTAARAMKHCQSERLKRASGEEMLWIAKRVRDILGDPEERAGGRGARIAIEVRFSQLVLVANAIGMGIPTQAIDARLLQALQQAGQRYVASLRHRSMQQLLRALKDAGIIWPGPLSVGKVGGVKVVRVDPDPRYAAENEQLLVPVRHLIDPLVSRLRRIDTPSEFTLHGLEDGELDFDEAANIALGIPGYHMETVVERDIDAELHLAIDCSGSMSGDKVRTARRLAKVFGAAISAVDGLDGRLWAFSSQAIYDLGPPGPNSGIVTIEGEAGNSDTHMLRHVGPILARSQRRRKVLLVLCDDGPDDMEEAKKLSQQLTSRGIIVVHLLVGVHGSPDIYPHELLYTSMGECLEAFPALLEEIITRLK